MTIEQSIHLKKGEKNAEYLEDKKNDQRAAQQHTQHTVGPIAK
jgi:hypothetical protein